MHIVLDEQVDEGAVIAALRRAFAGIASGDSATPNQFTIDLPGGGDVIHYPGVLASETVYAVKVSPYLPRTTGGAIVSAWTLLMSTVTGEPLALIDSRELTTERTAATSALAADLLLPGDARSAAIIGFGAIGRAHARYLKVVRPNLDIRVFRRSARAESDTAVTMVESIDEATSGADLVMLCTSAADDVIDPRTLAPGTVVTSISTNAAGAREIPSSSVVDLDVYLDAWSTTNVAAELREASSDGWDSAAVRGTLAEMVVGTARPRREGRVTYFRSVGLGIEDAAIAWLAHSQHERRSA